jgi:lipopolysaccharide export system ATP-binding protein
MTFGFHQHSMQSFSYYFSASDLHKFFRKRHVLKGVNIIVYPGEITGLLGPNGAGKTTCFSILAGIIDCDSGEVSVDGMDISALPIYQRCHVGIGYLPQDVCVFRGLSVWDNVQAVVEIVKKNTHPSVDEKIIHDRVQELLEKFNLMPLKDSLAITLSGGERRRLEIARCLATNPRYLLLDEPFTGVDPIAIGQIRDTLEQLKQEGIGILITDHNVRETLSLVDRAYIIADGKVIAEGASQSIIENELVRRIYLGEKFHLLGH